MAAAGLFQMSPYQWTNVAQLATANLQGASETTAKMDKKKPKSGGSGLGGILGSVVGGIAGSMIPGVGTAIGTTLGSAIGGGIGGAIDGGSEGAAQGVAGGLGMGMNMAGSDTLMGGLSALWGNLGMSGLSTASGTPSSGSGSSYFSNGYSSGIGDAMKLSYGPSSNMLRGMLR